MKLPPNLTHVPLLNVTLCAVPSLVVKPPEKSTLLKTRVALASDVCASAKSTLFKVFIVVWKSYLVPDTIAG